MKKTNNKKSFLNSINIGRFIGITVGIIVYIRLTSKNNFKTENIIEGFSFLLGQLVAAMMISIIFEFILYLFRHKK
jgi:hypothetical protein